MSAAVSYAAETYCSPSDVHELVPVTWRRVVPSDSWLSSFRPFAPPAPRKGDSTTRKREIDRFFKSIDCGDPRCVECAPKHEARKRNAHKRACGVVRVAEGETDIGSVWAVEPSSKRPAVERPRRKRTLSPAQITEAHAIIKAAPIWRCYDRDAWEVEVWRELTEPTITVIRHEKRLRIPTRVERAINRAQRNLLARSIDLRVRIDRGKREDLYAVPIDAGPVPLEIGHVVRLRKTPGRSLRDLIPRWRIVEIEGSEVEIEDTEDGERRRVGIGEVERT